MTTAIIPIPSPLLPPKRLLSLPSPQSQSPYQNPSFPPHLRRLLRLSIRRHDLPFAQSIHASIAKSPHLSNHTLLANSLISTYLHFDLLSDARKVFDRLPFPDVASFSSLISAYSKSGFETEAVALFNRMRQLGIAPNEFAFVAVLTDCIRQSNYQLGSQVHSLAIKTHHRSCVFVGNALLGMLVKCGDSNAALQLFDEMPERDVSSWNTLVLGMVKDCRYRDAFELFRRMKMEGRFGDQFSVSTLLTAACEGFSLKEGEAVHAYGLKIGLELDLSVGNSLIGFYSRFGSIEDVVCVFRRMPEKDVISWTGMLNGFMQFGLVESAVEVFHQMPERNSISYNALLSGFCRNGEGSRGLELFREILEGGKEISDFTLSSVVSACAMVSDRKKGDQIHGFVIKVGCEPNAWIEAALLDMYAKCGRMEDAEKIFERQIKDESFPIAWTSMISARAQNGQVDEALLLFHLGFKRDGMMFMDEVTVATVLAVCGTLGFTEMGEQIHCFALKLGVSADVAVGNAIVSMHSGCGNLDGAISSFNQMPRHDLVSWNALITSYLLHRKGDEALDVWMKMEKLGIEPDPITFLLIISACKYTSLHSMDTCHQLFTSMAQTYGIKPTSEHYAAMVDVLGYWGCFDEAEKLIETMPFKPDPLVWRALLDSCRLRSNLRLGRQAVQKLLASEPKDPSTYILVSNLYSASGRWHCSEKVREEMRGMGLKKNPVRSWIIHQNKVHSFYGRDRSHPQSKDIYSGLDVLILECTKAGYQPDTSFVLHEVAEYQKKHFLFYHSAKLAVTYGLLVGEVQAAVRVVKNIRLCGDCHEFLKIASSVTGREISVRDTSGFHRFKGGECSCGDYW